MHFYDHYLLFSHHPEKVCPHLLSIFPERMDHTPPHTTLAQLLTRKYECKMCVHMMNSKLPEMASAPAHSVEEEDDHQTDQIITRLPSNL